MFPECIRQCIEGTRGFPTFSRYPAISNSFKHMNKTYTLNCAAKNSTVFNEIATAIAEAFHLAASTATTICIADQTGAIVASVAQPEATIQGIFRKEQWTGPKRKVAELVETVEFDATAEVLALTYEQFVALQDRYMNSDDIGRNCVSWDGPYEVDIQDGIEAFFGVRNNEVTREHFDFVVSRHSAAPPTFKAFNVTARVLVRVQPGVDATDFVSDMQYGFISGTNGVVVQATEIVDCAEVPRS